jgi:hypothetical protein
MYAHGNDEQFEHEFMFQRYSKQKFPKCAVEDTEKKCRLGSYAGERQTTAQETAFVYGMHTVGEIMATGICQAETSDGDGRNHGSSHEESRGLAHTSDNETRGESGGTCTPDGNMAAGRDLPIHGIQCESGVCSGERKTDAHETAFVNDVGTVGELLGNRMCGSEAGDRNITAHETTIGDEISTVTESVATVMGLAEIFDGDRGNLGSSHAEYCGLGDNETRGDSDGTCTPDGNMAAGRDLPIQGIQCESGVCAGERNTTTHETAFVDDVGQVGEVVAPGLYRAVTCDTGNGDHDATYEESHGLAHANENEARGDSYGTCTPDRSMEVDKDVPTQHMPCEFGSCAGERNTTAHEADEVSELVATGMCGAERFNGDRARPSSLLTIGIQNESVPWHESIKRKFDQMNASRSFRNEVINSFMKALVKNWNLDDDAVDELGCMDCEDPLSSVEAKQTAIAPVSISIESESGEVDSEDSSADGPEVFSECEDPMPNDVEIESTVRQLDESTTYCSAAPQKKTSIVLQSNSGICEIDALNGRITEGSRQQDFVQSSHGTSGIVVHEDEASEDDHDSAKKKRKYDKLLACLFCHKLLKQKIKRHLVAVHAREPEIVELSHITSESERSLGYSRLVSRGNFVHNVKVLEKGEGTLIVGRRTNRQVAVSDYLPCIYCQTLYISRDLSRHVKNCKMKPQNNNTGSDKKVKHIAAQARMLLEGAMKQKYRPITEQFQDEIIATMRCDELTDLVKQDELILQVGSAMHRRLGKHRHHDISQRMRELARLVRQINSVRQNEHRAQVSLGQCLTGEMFDEVIEATRTLCCKFDDVSGRVMFQNPSIGLQLGHTLVKCCHLKVGTGIRSSNRCRHVTRHGLGGLKPPK